MDNPDSEKRFHIFLGVSRKFNYRKLVSKSTRLKLNIQYIAILKKINYSRGKSVEK